MNSVFPNKSKYLTAVHFLFCHFALGIILFAVPLAEALPKPIHHELHVTIDPLKSTAQIHDLIALYPGATASSTLNFLLRSSFRLETIVVHQKGNWTIDTESVRESGIRLTRLQIKKPLDQSWPELIELEVKYSGSFKAKKKSAQAGKKKNKKTQVLEGILLAGDSYFYPVFEDRSGRKLITFKLTVDTPKDWKTVSQGKRVREVVQHGRRSVTWQADNPMQEIFLIADRFVEYQANYKEIKLYTFLRKDDNALAGKYLEAAARYIKLYEKLLGSYPFSKFAMVENAQQTGYGMPSFTLLGSKVIRFPFILETSYPHEILHNWFGNSVYPDPYYGNWSEGLTTYLADHLFPEIEGKGDRYRFQELMKYLNYINEKNDFPLNEFKTRGSMASQAIGYGKMLMFFHMLRKEVGDKIFLQGLRDLYKIKKFRFAGFEIIRSIYESASKKNLSAFFRQWIMRTGAPELKLTSAESRKVDKGFALQIELGQNQKTSVFKLSLPVAIWLKGSKNPLIKNVSMTKKKQSYSWRFEEEPAAVLVDPYYDVFRRLSRKEVPVSLSQTYGEENVFVVLPTKEPNSRLMSRYKSMALSVTPKHRIIPDTDYSFADKSTAWFFGRTTLAAEKLKPLLAQYKVLISGKGVTVDDKHFPWKDHSFVFTVEHPADSEKSVTWVIADQPESLPGLMNKLPHYGKYGCLVFKGSAPDNQLKGIWQTTREGMIKKFLKGRYTLPPIPPLTSASP